MISTVVLATGLTLILIGIWGMLTHRNILRIVIAFSLIGTGTHILMVAIGYVAERYRADYRSRLEHGRSTDARR